MLSFWGVQMQHEVSALYARAFAVCVWLCAACSASDEGKTVAVPPARDAGELDATAGEPGLPPGCVEVVVSDDEVVEHLADFTARFEPGDPYARTLMLFGGMVVPKA